MKKILIAFLLFGVTLFMVACGESEIEKVETDPTDAVSEEATDPKEDETETEEEPNEDLTVGDAVNFNGLIVTLNEARQYEGDGEWETPDKDYFVVLDLSIENTTDEPESVSTMLQMSLVDSNSYTQDMSIMVDTKGSLDGEVGPGRKMAGEIAFDVEDAEFFEFIFEDPFQSGQAIWKIDLAE